MNAPFRRVAGSLIAAACLFSTGIASAGPLVLKCAWPNGPNADVITIDTDARTFQRATVDAGENVFWSTPVVSATVSDAAITATYRGATYTLNRYTGALSSVFATDNLRTVLQCEKYEKGQRKF